MIGLLRPAPAQGCAPNWRPTYGGDPSANGTVHTFQEFDDGRGPALYAGGAFTAIGGAAAKRVARWDGARWSALDSGFDAEVRALTVFDDGTGAALYAAGAFGAASGALVNGIAKWTGGAWLPLGSGMATTSGSVVVNALSVFDDGRGPALYAGGAFESAGGVHVHGIARWDGTAWTALAGGTNGSVETLAVFDFGAGPRLCVGGAFTSAGSLATAFAARWDGSRWTPFGTVAGPVAAFANYDDGTGPRLYAGGQFSSGSSRALDVLQWGGERWRPLGSMATNVVPGPVRAMAVYDDGSGPALYVGGDFTASAPALLRGVAKWDGTAWSTLQGGVGAPGSVHALAVFAANGRGALWVGGSFGGAGGVVSDNCAQWNGAAWSAAGGGLDDQVFALAEFDDGSGPALFAGGALTAVGGVPVAHIAKWNGRTWSALGAGVDDRVQALAVFDDGAGPALFAGGRFHRAGASNASFIARWDGRAWTPLGTGTSGAVQALAVYDDGRGPALYVAGLFTSAGGVGAPGIARWDGAAWSGLGGGTDAGVQALAVYDDGFGAALYAGGAFLHAGGVLANSIAKWDGLRWSALGSGVSSLVEALAVYDDGLGPALYAGGFLRSAGGVPAQGIAKWNGLAWLALGTGLSGGPNPQVRSLVAFDDGAGPALFAAGYFEDAGGTPSTSIARWNGAIWSALGSGVVYANALGVADDGGGAALVVGGPFAVGPMGDSYLAKWGCSTLPAVRTFGHSSAGCSGPVTLTAAGVPFVGNAAFALTGAGAPANAPGALVLGQSLAVPAALLGIELWVAPLATVPAASDPSGAVAFALPIPALANRAGGVFAAQLAWLGPGAPPPCPRLGWSASPGLEIAIQP